MGRRTRPPRATTETAPHLHPLVRVGIVHGRRTVVLGARAVIIPRGPTAGNQHGPAATTTPRRSWAPSSDVHHQKRWPPVPPATTLLASVGRCSSIVVAVAIVRRPSSADDRDRGNIVPPGQAGR